MAQIKAVISPRLGPDNRPLIFNEDGWRRAPVKIQIPASQTYSTTDRVVLVHDSAGDFLSQYGARIIRQVIFSNGFSTAGLAYGELKGEWLGGDTQQLQLRKIGNAGPGTGPVNDTELGAVSIGTGTITAEAEIYF